MNSHAQPAYLAHRGGEGEEAVMRWHTVRKFLTSLEVKPSEFGAPIERQKKVMSR